LHRSVTSRRTLKYQGEESRLEIGRSNIVREHVTMKPRYYRAAAW